jgi:Glycosyltransferase family 87
MRFPIVVAAVVATAVAILLFPLANQQRLRSTDFVNLYVGASIVAHGDGTTLYDRSVQGPLLQSLSGLPLTEYFLRPPFEAAIIAPLALLRFRTAYVIWTALNAALVALLCWLFASSIPAVRDRPIIGMSGFFFFPVLVSLVLGQDSIILLVIITAAYSFLRGQRQLISGLVLSLAAVKFQYLLIMTALLLLARKRRLVVGVLCGATVLLAISALVVGPRGLIGYVVFLRDFTAHAGYGSLHLELMVSLRGFLAGIGSKSPGLFIFGETALAAIAVACTQNRRDESLQFAAVVTASLLLSPYAHFADATVLLLPALIVVNRATKSPRRTVLLAVTSALFAVPLLLIALGGHYWWNSRIYLFFLAGFVFLLAVSAELYQQPAGFDLELHPIL